MRVAARTICLLLAFDLGTSTGEAARRKDARDSRVGNTVDAAGATKLVLCDFAVMMAMVGGCEAYNWFDVQMVRLALEVLRHSSADL